MKRKNLLFVLSLAAAGASYSSYAQTGDQFYDQPYAERNNGTFAKDAQILSFKYGLGNVSGTGYLYVNTDERLSHRNIGPLYLQYEYGIAEEIGLLAYGAYSYAKDVMDRQNTRSYHTHAFSMAAGVLYHFNRVIPVPNLDAYAGMGIGFRLISQKMNPRDASPSVSMSDHTGVFFLRAGLRYYIVGGIGVHLEFSPDKMSVLNAGVSYRF